MESSILHRIFWGIVLVAVGGVFLLDQTGTVDVDIGDLFKTYWPVFIIFFGVQGMLFQRGGAFWWNPLVVLIGVFFLGRNLEWFSWELGDLLRLIGPVALILFGLSLITRGNKRKNKASGWNGGRHDDDRWNPVTPPPMPHPPGPELGPPPAPPMSDDPAAAFSDPVAPPEQPKPHEPRVRPEHRDERWERRERHYERRQHRGHSCGNQWYDHNSRHRLDRFIGDVKLGDDPWDLQPMSISMFIGDTKLDLTTAQIPLGETRVYISSFIGDVKVYVPSDSDIGVQVVSSTMIGDVRVLKRKEGGLFNSITVETPNFLDSDRKVILIVSSFIGDVRVTKVG